MREAIGDIIEQVSNAPDDETRVIILRQHDHVALRLFLQIMMADDIKWLLPEGAPPYTPNQFLDQEGNFYSEIRRLYLFMEGGNPNLTPKRREELFIAVLESIHPKDAKLLIDVKDHKRPAGLTIEVVNNAFPGLLT